MYAPALLGLAISFMADALPIGAGTRIDVGTGARAELNVGRVPVTSVNTSAPGTEETVTLRSGVRLISPTSSLSLIYRPQYYLRLPDVLDIGRPLLLHDGSLNWAARFSRRLSLSWVLRSSAGELPGSNLLTVFDPGTGTVASSVVPVFRVMTSLGLNALTGKRHTTSVTVNASHNDFLDADTPLQSSENVGLDLSHSISLSRRTMAGVSGQIGYVAREDQQESATVGSQLFLSQQTGPVTSIRVAGGASLGWALAGDISWPLPTLEVGYRTQLRASGQSWNLNLASGTRAFFDVASALYRPQVFLRAGVNGRIHRSWTVASSLSFSADVSGRTGTPEDQPGQVVQPTQFNFNLPVSYRIHETLRLQFGLRLALAGPPLWDFENGTFQDQVSVFVALDWREGNEQSRGGWL